MKKIKKFIEEHRTEIIIGGGVIGIVIGGLIMRRYIQSKFLLTPKGLDVVSWDPNIGEPFTIEKVKELMDTLQKSNRTYAVVREEDKYSLIYLTTVRY